MAKQTKIQIDLEANLKQVTTAAKGLNLTDKQKERIDKYESGARLALKNDDLKTFRANFNNIVSIFKNAASTSNNLSTSVKNLTDNLAKLSKEINDLRKKQSDNLSALTKDQQKLTQSYAVEFYQDSTKSNPILSDQGKRVSRLAAITAASKVNKPLTKLTDADAQTLGLQSRRDLQKAAQYVKLENQQLLDIQNNIPVIDSQIQEKEAVQSYLTQQLNNLQEASSGASKSLDELYSSISQLGDITNEGITQRLNAEKLDNRDASAAPTAIPEINDKNKTYLGKAFKQFTVYALVIKGLQKMLKEAVSTVAELDKSLTEQAMVTGLTREQTYGLVKSYQDLAFQCGATTKEIASVSTEYMKQGKSIQESLVLTKAAVLAAKVARVSVGDSVNYLTTALNGFKLSAEDAMKVSDKFASVAASSATDYNELAIALSKVASQANLAGMSIDYTTALLAKGLETTREAPETMGTALKTIIARMRELSDYGSTLEGDTDLNNVESQLSYVGIALKDTNGELRSTEDVLDELGRKWETLNKNQQAALAKALAGTRQQSRLIAIMDDYERVIELQQIAERSSGATAAQASTYLQGIEALITKIDVAWEKIVMNFSNSDIIISIISAFSDIVNFISIITETTGGMIASLTVITTVVGAIVGNKLRQLQIAKEQKKIDIESQRIELTKLKQQQLLTALSQKEAKYQEIKNKLEYKQTLTTEERALLNAVEKEDPIAAAYANQLALLDGQESALNSIIIGWGGIFQYLGNVGKRAQELWSKFATWHAATKEANNQEIVQEQTKEQLAAKQLALKQQIQQIGVGIGVMAAITVAVVAITALIKLIKDNTFEGKIKKINEMSNEIYKLQSKSQEIKSVIDSFDQLDNKLIKTNKDLEEMNTLLSQVGDKLTEEDQQAYNALTTNSARIDFLRKAYDRYMKDAWNTQRQAIKEIQNMRSRQQNKLFDEGNTDADVLQARSTIISANNMQTYKQMDNLKKEVLITDSEASAIENLTRSMLENLSTRDAYNIALDEEGTLIKNLIHSLDGLDAAEKLLSSDYTFGEKIKAYDAIVNSLNNQGKLQASFKTLFKEYEGLKSLGDTVISFFDAENLSIESVNDIYTNLKNVTAKYGKIEQETFNNMFKQYIEILKETDSNILQATQDVFGSIIDGNAKIMNEFIDAYSKVTSIGILNMGQNIDSFKNSINIFYEKASKWSTMSESDKSKLISDYAELFSEVGNASGQSLLDAFNSGNYLAIEDALKNNPYLKKQLEQRLKEVETELKNESAIQGADRNEAYIKQLEAYKKYLNNVEDLFKASLELRLEQETNQLEEYKSLLQDQQNELEKSLNKRKEAYEKYFETINKEEEDNDYETKTMTLVSNISKLSSSTNASAVSQSKNLQQQLLDLEKERLKTLRERAQDAVVNSIDDQLSKISDQFEELLSNNRELLSLMMKQLDNPSEYISQLLTNKIASGATALELQEYISSLNTTYGSVLGNQLSNISASERGNQLTLNVSGEEITLNQNDQQNLYLIIKQALREIGLR